MTEIDAEERVDRFLNALQKMGKDPFINAIQESKGKGLLDSHTNLVKGTGELLKMVEGITEDEDFLATARAKILTALYVKLGFKFPKFFKKT